MSRRYLVAVHGIFLRLRERYDDEGDAGLADRRVGRVRHNRAADEEVEKFTRLHREQYLGFNIRHFSEFAKRDHGFHWGYMWTRPVLAEAGPVTPSKRGGAHRLRRPMRPMRGMMIHQDASAHR